MSKIYGIKEFLESTLYFKRKEKFSHLIMDGDSDQIWKNSKSKKITHFSGQYVNTMGFFGI